MSAKNISSSHNIVRKVDGVEVSVLRTEEVTRTVWVRSSGDNMILLEREGRVKIEAADSGSQYILNSALSVIFPSVNAPPMMEMALICSAVSGNAAKSKATFVIVPVTANAHVPWGVDIMASRMASTAGVDWGLAVGVGRRVVPSMPVSPWIPRACTAGRMNGLLAPG